MTLYAEASAEIAISFGQTRGTGDRAAKMRPTAFRQQKTKIIMQLGEFRADFAGAAKACGGGGVVVQAALGEAEIIIILGGIGSTDHRQVETRRGLCGLAPCGKQKAQRILRFGEIGPQAQRASK